MHIVSMDKSTDHVVRTGDEPGFWVKPLRRANPDGWIPESHTCFFTIDMPEYTSEEAAARQIRLAIHECSGFAFA